MPATPRQIHIDQILTVFNEPPTLEAVAQDSAQAWLDLHLPAYRYSAARILLGTDAHYQSLAEQLVLRLATAKPTLLVVGYHYVVQRNREVYTAGGPSLEDVERLINHCGPRLLQLFSERLQAWWREGLPSNSTRWGYLADQWLELLYDAPAPPGMSAQRFGEVFPRASLRARRPDPRWRLGLPVYTVHLRHDGETQALPLLLIVHAPYTLLYSPASGVHLLDNLDAVQPLLSAYASPLLTQSFSQWFAHPVQGDPFDALAATYLARQLQEIASLNTRIARPVQAYQQLLGYILDSKRWFVPGLSAVQETLRPALPRWLTAADSDDSFAAAGLLHGLVLANQQGATQDFLDGIEPLQTFAASQLRACLTHEEPRAANLTPAEISLNFERVIAAPVPVPGGFIAGEVHTFTLTLTELALENFGGLPRAPTSIHLKDETAPDWLTYDLLKTCVTRVDIGQTYPQLLKKHLIDDAVDAARRQGLFTRQWRVQLPLQALQWKIQGLHGLTSMGFRRLNAAVQANKARRVVEGQAVALWPLAFKARPGDSADVVEAHFVIGPCAGDQGPHLLYRPLFSPALLEYASEQALLAAIQLKGEVQDTVLAWIAPRRQAVYANNGFREPHVRHFLQGDEFTAYATPEQAQMSRQISDADPAQQVFTATAQALVTLADRQTVSNAEQRWASLKEAGWLLFNSLMPLVSGPLMLGGWLLQLMDSARNDLPALDSADDQVRSAAVLDLLVNLMAILAHQAAPHDAHAPLALEHPVFEPLALPSPVPVEVSRSIAPVDFEAPGGWANARDTLTAAMQTRLDALSLKTLAKPWPATLANAERSGPWQGLRRDAAYTVPQWQALVRGQQFRVRIEHDRVRVISADGSRVGPWLKSLGQGVWDFDLQLRLRGGADRPAPAPANPRELERDYRQAGDNRDLAQRALMVARGLLDDPKTTLDEQRRKQISNRYVNELEKKLHFTELQLQALKKLRDLGPREGYERELSGVLESLIVSAQLLDVHFTSRRIELTVVMRTLLEQLENNDDEAVFAQLSQHRRELADNQKNTIRWRSTEQRFLEELNAVPRVGREKARHLSAIMPERKSVLELQVAQVNILWSAAIDVTTETLDDTFFVELKKAFNRTDSASSSLAKLSQVHASEAERIQLLDSIAQVLAQTDDSLAFWRTTYPDSFNLDYLDSLRDVLRELHDRAIVELDELQQLQAKPVPQPTPKRQPKPKPATSAERSPEIIRTRNGDLYLAHVDGAAAQVQDTEGKVIGAYAQASDRVWELNTPPKPPLPDPQLGAMLKHAAGLLRDVDKAIASVEAMIGTANEPASLQALLHAQANSRQWAAEAIGKKLRFTDSARLAEVQRATARTVQEKLEAAAARLEEAGLKARIRGSRRKDLSASDIQFLKAQGEIDIKRIGERVPQLGRSDDFLQVYAVNDAKTRKLLCYAHFHYAREVGPDDSFTAAHLKSPEQEHLGRQAQARVEAQAFLRIRQGQTGRVQQTLDIRRAQISLASARSLFFSVDDSTAAPEKPAQPPR